MTDWASVRSRPKTLNELQFRDWPPDPLHPISPTDEFAPLELGADGALLWKGCDEPPRLLLAAGCSAIISPRRPGFVITSRNAKPRHDTQPGLGDGLRGMPGDVGVRLAHITRGEPMLFPPAGPEGTTRGPMPQPKAQTPAAGLSAAIGECPETCQFKLGPGRYTDGRPRNQQKHHVR
jgi:hypothetical protein